jgi:hypothetical protein
MNSLWEKFCDECYIINCQLTGMDECYVYYTGYMQSKMFLKDPEYSGNFHHNVSNYKPTDMVSYFNRLKSSSTPLWESQMPNKRTCLSLNAFPWNLIQRLSIQKIHIFWDVTLCYWVSVPPMFERNVVPSSSKAEGSTLSSWTPQLKKTTPVTECHISELNPQ